MRKNILRNQEPDRNKLRVVGKEQIVPHNTVHCSGNKNTSVATQCRAYIHWRYQGFPDHNSDKSVWVLFSCYVPCHLTSVYKNTSGPFVKIFFKVL